MRSEYGRPKVNGPETEKVDGHGIGRSWNRTVNDINLTAHFDSRQVLTQMMSDVVLQRKRIFPTPFQSFQPKSTRS